MHDRSFYDVANAPALPVVSAGTSRDGSGDSRRQPQPKILLLGKLPPPYIGPAIATRILLRSELCRRYQVLHLNTVAVADVRAIGRWQFRKLWKHAVLYGRLVRLLARARPDLTLVPISQSTLGFLKDAPYILLSRLFGVTTVVQLRGSDIQNWLARATPVTRAFAGFVLRSAQGVIVQGQRLRSLFAGYFPPERIFVVPNGADYDVPSVVRSGPVRVLFLSSLAASKGIEDALEAVRIAREKGAADFVLHVVGMWREAETRERCEALVAAHDLPVRFHGPAYDEDKLRHLAAADIFLYPPRGTQGHSWVIVEALAAGLPIVATDRGPIEESVREGHNGFIVPPGAPARLAHPLRLLVDDETRRRRMGAASRAHYLAHFTERKMVECFSRCFDALLQAG